MPAIVQGQPIAYPTIVTSDAPTTTPAQSPEALIQSLAAMGFPHGLSKELINSTAEFPVRFWVVDNSGSMNMNDGTRLVAGSGRVQSVKASRWGELCDTVVGIAQLAEALGARTDFHLLNRTAHGQYFSVANDGGAGGVGCAGERMDVAALQRKMRCISPAGSTPLTEAVMQIVSLIEPSATKLRASGKRAVVTLATDGLPNDKPSFREALRALQRLPVWLVVRLCTDDEGVVEYWNELDGQLEAEMEVLDDEFGEAAEVHGHNAFLTYGPLLHRAREFGLHNPLFDLLDEQALVPNQVRLCCEALLGCGTLPEPEADLPAFKAAVREGLTGVAPTFDPVSRAMRPWINADRLCRPKKAGWLSCFL